MKQSTQEILACFEPSCTEPAIMYCNCQFLTIYSCNEHISLHTSTYPDHDHDLKQISISATEIKLLRTKLEDVARRIDHLENELSYKISTEVSSLISLLREILALERDQMKELVNDSLKDYSIDKDRDVHVAMLKIGIRKPDIVRTLNKIGDSLRKEYRLEESTDILLMAVNLSQEVGELEEADSLHKLAKTSFELRKKNNAYHLFSKSLNIRKRLLGNKHLKVANSFSYVGLASNALDKYRESIYFSNIAIDIMKENIGEDHPIVARSYLSIGYAYFKSNKTQEALKFGELSLGIKLRTLSESHHEVASHYLYIGTAFLFLEQYEESYFFLNQSLNIRKNLYGEKHPLVGKTLEEIGNLFSKQKDYNEAIKLYQQSLNIFQSFFENKEHKEIVNNLYSIANMHEKLGNRENALNIAKEALKLCKRIKKGINKKIIMISSFISQIHYKIGEYKDALGYLIEYKDIVQTNEKIQKKLKISNYYYSIASCYYMMRKYELALNYFEIALNMESRQQGNKKSNKHLINMFSYMTFCLLKLKVYEEAHFYAKKSLALINLHNPSDQNKLNFVTDCLTEIRYVLLHNNNPND